MPAFYDAGPVQQVAINLFYGWGYNFYRKENQLRADDLLVRSKVSEILSEARRAVSSAEGGFRTEFLPPPSRDRPRPDAEALVSARALEALVASITAAEGRIRALPTPENDRIAQRHRNERDTLERLLDADRNFVGAAESLRILVDGQDAAWILGALGDIKAHLSAIDAAVRLRAAILTV